MIINNETYWDFSKTNLNKTIILSVELNISKLKQQLTNNIVKTTKVATPETQARENSRIIYLIKTRELYFIPNNNVPGDE